MTPISTLTAQFDWVALAWPILVGLSLVGFRKPLRAFFTNVGARVSKISFAGVSLELRAARGAVRTLGVAEVATSTNRTRENCT